MVLMNYQTGFVLYLLVILERYDACIVDCEYRVRATLRQSTAITAEWLLVTNARSVFDVVRRICRTSMAKPPFYFMDRCWS